MVDTTPIIDLKHIDKVVENFAARCTDVDVTEATVWSAEKLLEESEQIFTAAQNSLKERLNAATAALRLQIPVIRNRIEVRQIAQARKLAAEIEQSAAAPRSFGKIEKIEIVNIDEVPRAYLMLNSIAVYAAISAGITRIPGIRIIETAADAA